MKRAAVSGCRCCINASVSFCAVQLQRLVTTGALPCSKEEAASLAAIQLRLEECSPKSKPALNVSLSVSRAHVSTAIFFVT